MKITGLDGKEYTWNFSKHYSRKERSGKSSYHEAARQLLKEIFPGRTIYEETTLPGSKKMGRKSILYADFFVPFVPLVVEVHGQQHYQYTDFFHKSKMDFFLGQSKDRDKIEFCQINNIKIAILPYNEQDKWATIIMNSISQ